MLLKPEQGAFQVSNWEVRAFGMIAGGSGITPMFQVRKKLKHLLRLEDYVGLL